MTAAELARALVRRLPDTIELTAAAVRLADDLLAVGARVPAGDRLIAGGSLARGEPTIFPGNRCRRLVSDVDLLYVHSSDRPMIPIDELAGFAERIFPAVDLMVLSLCDYRVLRTSLGHDFKNVGLDLTGRGLPPHEPVELDARDAYEILLYYTQAYFWSGLHEQWTTGTLTREFHLTINRLCLKILRAAAMLDGAYAHHDFDHMPPQLAAHVRTELEWRSHPYRPPADPGRFWTYLADALCRFDAAFGHRRADAVNHSRYAATPSGRVVARHHRAAHHLARAMTAVWCDTADPRALATVAQRVWARYTGWDGTHPQPGPEDYFRRHRRDIHDHLLAMKVQAV